MERNAVSKTSARERLKAEQARQRGRDRRILIIVAAGIVVLLIAGGLGFQAWRTSQQPSAGPTPAASATPVTITDGQPIVFGKTSAPAQIDLFEDFHCPHCADFEKTYQPVLDEAMRSGKAAVRIYPLAFIDAGSAAAANGFACAAQAGYGESYFRGLFANTSLDWSSEQLITLMAQVSGQPASADFQTCVQQSRNAGWVRSISVVATQKKVEATPTMFLNNELVDIANLTPDALVAKIDQAGKS